jgi:hypothetical protein
MNFYWIKLDLAGLKLKDIPEARYIYCIFVDPITGEDLSNEICFIFFWLQTQLARVAHGLEARLYGSRIVPAPRHSMLARGMHYDSTGGTTPVMGSGRPTTADGNEKGDLAAAPWHGGTLARKSSNDPHRRYVGIT